MKILLRIIILFTFGVLLPTDAVAQSTEWQLMHKGNRSFGTREYNAAGAYYNRALQLNGNNSRALYNLANVKLAQSRFTEALDLYKKSAEQEKSSLVRSMAYHNRGYVYQRLAGASTDPSQKQNNLKAAINEYKQSLRENPMADGTRYNLALCQKQLKESRSPQGGEQPKGNQQQANPKAQERQQQQAPKKRSENENDPLLNYARQAEKQTRNKLNRRSFQKSLDKNC